MGLLGYGFLLACLLFLGGAWLLNDASPRVAGWGVWLMIFAFSFVAWGVLLGALAGLLALLRG
jgi:hypothetical protein